MRCYNGRIKIELHDSANTLRRINMTAASTSIDTQEGLTRALRRSAKRLGDAVAHFGEDKKL